jgi:hypothetical protein
MSTTWQVVAGVDSAATSSEIRTVANNIDNVKTVGDNITNVNTVAGVSSNVTTVAGISSDVTTVATNNSNVNVVAGISSDVSTVANDGTDIGVVAANTSNINTVAGIDSDVTTVAGISSDVTTVAADGTDIGIVATDIANINTTAGSISNVNTVATNIANVNTVAADGTDIGVVAGISSDVTTVSGINANVTTVAGISADVTSVAGDATDIGTVATNIANVNTTAGSIANINTVASNNTNVTTVANDIANVNTTASNITGVNSFAERYRVVSSDPTSDNHEGDLIYNTTSDSLKVFTNSSFSTINTSGGLANISEDTNPQLGGNLDTNGNAITGTSVGINASNGDLMITATQDGPVSLRYDGNLKLSTKSDGVNITGELEADSLDIDGNADITGTLNTHTIPGGTGTFALTSDLTFTASSTDTLTNKTINSASNTITITESNISDLGSYITASSTDTLTNKSGNISQWTNDSGYLTSFTETNNLSSAVTWANVPDANITQSSVTQHQAALSITESQISDLGSYITASSTDTLTNKSGNISQWTNDSGYITGVTAGSGIDVSGTTISVEPDLRDGIEYIGLDGGDYIRFNNNSSQSFFVNAGERARLEADGDFHADGDIIAYSTTVSDIALKSNIEMIPNALDKIDEVRGVTFTRHNGQKSAGIIAQELEKVLPEAVREKELKLVDGKKYKTVEYDAIHGLLINCIKELKEQIKELKNGFTK